MGTGEKQFSSELAELTVKKYKIYNEIAKLVFTGLRVFSQKALDVRKMLS